MSHFPASPAFTGFNTPSRIEADILDLAHEGAFNGDGMISRFHIHNGRCDFRQRRGLRGA